MRSLAIVIILAVLLNGATDDRGLRLKLKQMRGEQRVALVIGNADYETFGDLRNPVNDARAMRDVLEGRNFNVLYLENARGREMTRMLRRFEDKLGNGGIGLFYYAGHGITVKGKNFLIPVDADIKAHNEVRFESVDVDRVLAKMESAGNRLNLVILDACRNDPFKRGGGGGLAPLDAAQGMYIAFATAPGKTASDGTGDNGIFTSALLRYVKEPKTVEEVFKYVRADVMRETGGDQIPWTSSSIVGDFYFTLPSVQDRYALTVIPEPADATVYIMNIRERYQPGIRLEPNKSYELKVVRQGYQPLQQTIFLHEDTKLPVALQKIGEAPRVAMKTDAPPPSEPRTVETPKTKSDNTWWYVGGGVALLAGGGAAAAAGGGGGGDDDAGTTVAAVSDTLVTLTWEGTNNLDLIVEDPCGNHITAASPTATCDTYQGTLTQESNADTIAASPRETVRFTGGGQSGVYYVYVNDTYNRDGGSTDFSISTSNNDTVNTASGTVEQNALLPVVYFTH